MARTLLISEIFPPKTGGSGRWFWEIYRRLPQEEFLIAAGEDIHADAFDQTHDRKIWRVPLTLNQWGVLSVGGLSGYWKASSRIAEIVRSHRVQMVHCGRCLPEGMLGLWLKTKRGIPYACFAHGEDITCATYSREHSWLTRRVLRNAAYVIPNSQNTKRILQEEWKVPEDRIHLLHPGVDTNYFVPAAPDSMIREQLGWADRPVILTVGRLQKRKGQDHLILALSKIREVIPHILYSIVGDGAERETLVNLVEKTGLQNHVQFQGEVSDEILLRSYQQCDLFALPNRQVGKDIEGFGMVLLEAQACGKPVLAGDSGGTAETMRIPETGRVVNCESPELLASTVVELLETPHRLLEMGSNSRSWVVSQFDWTALSLQARELFQAGEDNPKRSAYSTIASAEQ